jgi:hypothetical protein
MNNTSGHVSNVRYSPFVLVEDIVRIILEDLDPVWLLEMWDSNVETRRELIDVIYLVYMIKTHH